MLKIYRSHSRIALCETRKVMNSLIVFIGWNATSLVTFFPFCLELCRNIHNVSLFIFELVFAVLCIHIDCNTSRIVVFWKVVLELEGFAVAILTSLPVMAGNVSISCICNLKLLHSRLIIENDIKIMASFIAKGADIYNDIAVCFMLLNYCCKATGVNE